MAATEKGVWDLQEVRDKQLASEWEYTEVFELWSWGNNGSGVLGQNQPTSTNISSPVLVDSNWSGLWNQAATTGTRAFAFKNPNEFWSWGSNSYGSLGHNNQTSYSSPKQVSGTNWNNIQMGTYGGIAVKNENELYMWGYNSDGQLGLNNGTNISSPTQIPGEWSSARYAITHSSLNSGGVKTDGTLWLWGQNDQGQLGQGNNTKQASPVQVPGTTWSSISNGSNFYCALETDGSASACGNNNYGQLGLNDTTNRNTFQTIPGTWSRFSASVGTAGLGVKTDGTLWTWGRNNSGQLGHNNRTNYSSPKQVGTSTDWVGTKIVAGSSNFQAVKNDGTLWVWGNCEEGELGLNQGGYPQSRSSPTQIPGTTWAHVGYGGKCMYALRT